MYLYVTHTIINIKCYVYSVLVFQESVFSFLIFKNDLIGYMFNYYVSYIIISMYIELLIYYSLLFLLLIIIYLPIKINMSVHCTG